MSLHKNMGAAALETLEINQPTSHDVAIAVPIFVKQQPQAAECPKSKGEAMEMESLAARSAGEAVEIYPNFWHLRGWQCFATY